MAMTHPPRVRRGFGVLLAAVVVGIGGCVPVDRGSAFTDQFRPFLENRDDLESFRVSGSNTLPWAGDADVWIELSAQASDDDIVETVWEITHHEVEDPLAYDLMVTVAAENAAGEYARAEFWIGVNEPAPDSDEARDFIADRLETARQLVALGTGPTTLESSRWQSTVTTGSDPWELVTQVCEEPQILRTDERLVVRAEDDDVSQATRRVELAEASSCADLEDVDDLLELARENGLGAAYDVTFTRQADPRVTLYGDVSLEVAEVLEDFAFRAGLDLSIV